jgi:hypothetical protein
VPPTDFDGIIKVTINQSIMKKFRLLLHLEFILLSFAFQAPCPITRLANLAYTQKISSDTASSPTTSLFAEQNNAPGRRQFLGHVLVPSLASFVTTSNRAVAAEITSTSIEMKTFVDPIGLFVINVPKRFFAIRRTVKGDLPDEQTGKGRRGSSIFTAGDLAKAEVIAVERFPTAALLIEEGIQPTVDLTTFPSIGDPIAVAKLISLRRDRDKPGQSRTEVVPDSVSVSDDGKVLTFRLITDIDVQKPELLMEQTGLSELKRITLAKATLTSGDGQMMAVFASALQQDFQGEDGNALQNAVDSFVAINQQPR